MTKAPVGDYGFSHVLCCAWGRVRYFRCVLLLGLEYPSLLLLHCSFDVAPVRRYFPDRSLGQFLPLI